MNVTIPELAGWLKGFDDIAVFGHRAPDGDACGSCAAVTLALRALGKRACACLPGGMPEYLRFLPGQDLRGGGRRPAVRAEMRAGRGRERPGHAGR